VAKLPQTKTEPKTQLERIAAVHPKYAALLTKRAELAARYEAVIAEGKPLGEEQRRHQISWVAQLPKTKPRPIVRHAGATALLGDLLPEQPIEETSPPPPRPSWPGEQRLAELGTESEAITEAIKLIQPALKEARREYSKLVAAQRGAEYTAIVETIVDAANAFGDTLLQHHQFINQQREDGVAWQYFRPIDVVTHFADLAEDFSPLRRLILAAIEQRHVGAGKTPSWKMPVDIAYLQEAS
jgi:hypothetical protein